MMKIRRIASRKELTQKQFDFVFTYGTNHTGFATFKNATQVLKALKEEYEGEDYSEYKELILSFANKEVLIESSDTIGFYDKEYFIGDLFVCGEDCGVAFNSNCFI